MAEKNSAVFDRMAEKYGRCVRRYQRRYQAWQPTQEGQDGLWVDIGSEEEIAPPSAKAEDYQHHIREVQGICNALQCGKFVLLEQDGTFHVGHSAVGRYIRTEFPRRERRMW